jgi:hypothetical protein
MLKAVLIAASLAVAMPWFAQQVRVIKGDIEHVYGIGGQLLDDADLQARNQRAWEHRQAETRSRLPGGKSRSRLGISGLIRQSLEWATTVVGLSGHPRHRAEDRSFAEDRHLAEDG